jgi:alkaline phosphatase D
MRFNRRQIFSFLALGAAPEAALAAAPAAAKAAFLHGVASGDPQTDRVILWTRVSPEPVGAEVMVQWEMAEEADFKRIVARGRTATGPGRDYTVKVDAGGLKPGRDYHYRFRALGAVSPAGRTRTLPTGKTDRTVLAVVSCSLYPAGYFNAYDHIAKGPPVDAVLHLGDYIYEYGAGPADYGMAEGKAYGLNRIPEPAHEIVSLSDYRTRHALYKRDPDLQAAHAAAPWICVWDDHEVANDTYVTGAENHQPAAEGPFDARKAVALQAYYEWMPIREPQPGRALEAINRSFAFGDLARLIMVETRLVGRSQQLEFARPGDIPLALYDVADKAHRRKIDDPAALQAALSGRPLPAGRALGPDPVALRDKLSAPSRSLMGPTQEAWVKNELAASVKAGQVWQVLGNQVVMARVDGPNIYRLLPPAVQAPLAALFDKPEMAEAKRMAELFAYDGVPSNLDSWDGYPAARERLYDAIRTSQGNAIVLAGDSHAFWVNELYDDAGAVRVAAEFGTSSVTSPSWGDELPQLDLGPLFAAANKEVVLCDQKNKGYVRLTLTPEAAVAELIATDVRAKPYASQTTASFRVTPAAGPGVGPVMQV